MENRFFMISTFSCCHIGTRKTISIMADLMSTKAPQSLMDYLELMFPLIKTYFFVFVLYKLAQHFNASLDAEAALQDKERVRRSLCPWLST